MDALPQRGPRKLASLFSSWAGGQVRHRIRLVVLALAHFCFALPASASHREKAEEVMAFIQTRLYDAQAQLYRPTYPPDPKALPYDFMWPSGVQLHALADATRAQPDKYKPLLYAFAQGLQRYWDAKAAVPGFNAYAADPSGSEKYYDDNAWLVLGFVDAYEVTRDPMFLDWARATQRFVLSGWDEKLGGGIYWHQSRKSKNTCACAPAAAGALRLHQVGGDAEQLSWAIRLRAWLNAKLQDADGLYWDNINLDGQVDRTKWTYNTALMIQTNTLLYQIKRDQQYLAEAKRLADAALRFWTDPATGSLQRTEETPSFTHMLCEALLRLHEVTKDTRYLNAVRSQAAFAYRYARDARGGGYWSRWSGAGHKEGASKMLLDNAAAARLFWLLAPYQDAQELYTAGIEAASRGNDAAAEVLLRDAADSDAEAVEARYRLWKVLVRRGKTAAADEEAAVLIELAENRERRARLEALGWKHAAAAGDGSASAPAEEKNWALAALGSRARASSEDTAQERFWKAGGVLDGSRAEAGWGNGHGWASKGGQPLPQWLEVDFGKMRTVSRFVVTSYEKDSGEWSASRWGVVDYVLQVWDAKSGAWKTVVTEDKERAVKTRVHSLPKAVQTSRFRILIGKVAPPDGQARLLQLEAWGPV